MAVLVPEWPCRPGPLVRSMSWQKPEAEQSLCQKVGKVERSEIPQTCQRPEGSSTFQQDCPQEQAFSHWEHWLSCATEQWSPGTLSPGT